MSNYAAEMDQLIRNINSAIRKNGRIALQEYQITLVQFHALLAIQEEPLSMGELCVALGVASSTVTELVDRMEENGLVARVRDPEDRRIVRILLLNHGKEIFKKVYKRREEFLAGALREMPEQDTCLLLELLRKLNDAISS